MTIWKMKGRNELTGSVSGNMYLIEEDGKEYCYLVNILNPSNIYIISKSNSMKKVNQIEELPNELKLFHQKYLELSKSLKHVSSEDVTTALKNEKKQKELDFLNEHFIHSHDATKYVISKIGSDYKDVKTKYLGKRLAVYIIDNTWKLTIEKDSNHHRLNYSLILLSDEREQYCKNISELKKIGIPYEVAKCLVGLPIEDAKKVWKTIKEHGILYGIDVNVFSFSLRMEIATGVDLSKLSLQKRHALYDYYVAKM